MKKLITLLGMIWLLWSAAYAQDCTLKVQFNIIPASCYNNGKVAYALLDVNGNPVSSADDLGLEDVRIYYKVNENDSSNYSNYYAGGWDTLTIDYGTYIIGVEAACRKGDGNYIKLDTHKLMEIPTTYVTPVLNSFYNIAKDSTAYGNRPSLDCINNGRIQLKIEHGKFPHYVTIMDYATGDTLRTDTITQRQYNGTSLSRYNYKDYYSIDNLPPGDWVFAVVDGCEYGHAYHRHQVSVVKAPELVSIYDYTQSGEYVDSLSTRYVNVTVNIDNLAHHYTSYISPDGYTNKKYWYNLAYMPQLAEYRINYGGNIGATEWKPVPAIGYTGYNNSYCRITLLDTVMAILCEDILDKTLTIEWRDKCHDTIISQTFSFPKSLCYRTSSSTKTDSSFRDGCISRSYYHTHYHYIYLNSSSSSCSTYYSMWKGSFVKPLVWVYTDVNTGNVIKRDTVANLSTRSYLYDTDVEDIYGPKPYTIRVKRQLMNDECGEIYYQIDNLTYTSSSSSYTSTWYSSYSGNNNTCTGLRSVYTYGNYYNAADTNLDGTVVRLITSPNNNFYNFEAVYDASTQTWAVTKSNPDNNATITGYADGTRVTLEDYGLPGGTYTFQIISPCGIRTTTTNPSFSSPDWTISYSSASCITGSRSISLRGRNYNNPPSQDIDSTVIRLESSPYNNRYNFEAVYSATDNRWTITKGSLENTATISGGSNGLSLSISDYGLPNGTYNFVVHSPCGTYPLTTSPGFSNMLFIDMVEEPEYTIEDECIKSYITYTKGRFERHYYQTSSQPDQEYVFLPSQTTTAPTYIQIISGPVGGYDDAVHQLNEPIRISMPGKFVVNIRPYSSYYSGGNHNVCPSYVSSYCYCNYFDTIYYDRNTVEFEYDYAMLCDSSSTTGNVYVKGINGTAPYVYTLYLGPDKTGPVYATNSTGEFIDVPITSTDTLSCMVRDSCGNYFHVNIRPETWTDLQKVWFDNGLTVSTTCEGNTVCVNALSIGSILSYEWSGPNGFSDTESRSCVFIPKGADEGWYKVHIYNTGCTADYEDSIYLNIDRAPSVELDDDFTVCPGAPAELRFFPTSPNPTDQFTLTIVLETESGKTTQNLVVAAGDTAKYILTPLTPTKVYVTSVNDGSCDYTIVEDTQYVSVYTINPYTVTTTHDTVCWETTANLSASSSLTPPYAIRWYTDYNLTQLVQEDSIFSDGEISSRVLPNMVRDSIFYIMVESNEYCPTTYGMPIHTMNMNNGSTQLSLGNTYRFYDSGGPNANYSTNELLTHTFSSTDGKPVTLKFESFSFSSTSHLYIFSGSTTEQDSLLYHLQSGSSNPGTITSRGDVLTVYFVSGGYRAAGWSAIVEHEPAKAIAKVRPKNTVVLRDTVCQSQTLTYADPNNISPDVTSLEDLSNAMRTTGTHTFSNVLVGAGKNGCDSTVTFHLTVNPPPRHDTTVVITNVLHEGYTWHGQLYEQAGNYTHFVPLDDGCDSLDILYLVVLDIDTSSLDICLGDSTDLIISVTKQTITESSREIPRTPRLGDVLCTDGSTMHPDSFLLSNKTAMGVVLSVDAESGYGRAIALTNAYNNSSMRWAYNYTSSTHSKSAKITYAQAILDMDGLGNTNEILRTVKAAGSTNTASHAPVAHYCKFYNHNTYNTGTDSLGWYLPAAGEMQLIYGNRVELNKTLTKLRTQSTKNTLLTNSSYWTSTEYNNSYAWYLYSTGYLYYYGSKTTTYYARPVIQFPLP